MTVMHATAVGQDAMTGLPQYDGFVEQFDTLVARTAREGGSVSMGLVDVDHFARLNERHGRSAGDGVLKALAGFLSEQCSERGRVFRYGGDAFAVLLEDTEKEDAFLMMEGVRNAFEGEREVEADGERITLSASITIGVASYPDDGAQVQEVARKANEAVYRAKVTGPNKVCLAREEKMVTKTTHYTQGQLHGLSRLAKREGVGEAQFLREALDDLLRKHNA